MANLKNTTVDTNLKLPQGTTAQRPASPSEGQIRYNTDTASTEFWNGTNWRSLADTHPEATGGTVVDTDIGGVPYRIHYFTETGTSTLTVTNPGEVEYLIVAGGGSGGSKSLGSGGGTAGGGGGGAGGVVTGTKNVTTGSYSIIVGAGGPSVGNEGSVNQRKGINGDNSQALSMIAIGGGGGGGNNQQGNDGGSGGGAGDAARNQGGQAQQSTSLSGGYGNNGGGSLTNNNYPKGGGGGAGQSGITGVDGKAGDGGIGIYIGHIFPIGEAGWVAGGGGGSWRNGSDITGAATGGLGGGTNGGIQNSSLIDGFYGSSDKMPPAMLNTGGGSGGEGGASRNNLGSTGPGGSGVVIIKYPKNSSLESSPDETRPSFQPYNYARDVRPITARDGLVLELDAANPLSYSGTGTTWQDLSGKNNNGTLTSGVGFTSEYFGALTFNDSTHSVDIPQTPDFNILSYTYAFWIRRREPVGGYMQFLQRSSNRNPGIWFYKNETNRIHFSIKKSDGANSSINPSGFYLNEWHYFTATVNFDGIDTTMRAYTDGIETASQVLSNKSPQLATGGTYIGKRLLDLGDLKIYNRALSDLEIIQNFNATRGRYGI